MKIKSIFFLVVFTSFLVTPAFVNMLNCNVDLTSYFSSNEEETHDKGTTDSEKITNRAQKTIPENSSLRFLKSLINSRYLPTWDNVYFDTVSPPPELSVFIG